MKVLVWFVTLFVVFYTLLTQLAVPFPITFFTFLIALTLLFHMIWRILKSPYKTNKVFDDWYEDKDIRL